MTQGSVPSDFFISELCDVYHLRPEAFSSVPSSVVMAEDVGLLLDTSHVRVEEDVRARIKKLRGNETWVSFLERVNLSYSILTASKSLSIQTLEKIANACSVSREWILWGDEESRNHPVEELIPFLRTREDIREQVWKELALPLNELIDMQMFYRRLQQLIERMPAETIHDRYVMLCKAEKDSCGLNRKELAEICGLVEIYFSLPEEKLNKARPSTLHRIGRAVGVGEQWLACGVEENLFWPADTLMKRGLRKRPDLRSWINEQMIG